MTGKTTSRKKLKRSAASKKYSDICLTGRKLYFVVVFVNTASNAFRFIAVFG